MKFAKREWEKRRRRRRQATMMEERVDGGDEEEKLPLLTEGAQRLQCYKNEFMHFSLDLQSESHY